MFRSRVCSNMAVTDLCRGGGDVDDPPPSGIKHCRKKNFAAIVDTGQVGLQCFIPQSIRHFSKLYSACYTGIVDKNLYRAPALGDIRFKPFHLISIRYVTGQRKHFLAIAGNFRRFGMELALIACSDNDPDSLTVKRTSQGRTESSAAAGNQDDSSLHGAHSNAGYTCRRSKCNHEGG